MAALQKSVSSPLVGVLAASCLLLIALAVQEGAAVPISAHCWLKKANFQPSYIVNHTFMMAEEASFEDNNTDIRLISNKLYEGVNKRDRCYLMKQVLNFTLEEVLLPKLERFQPYMEQVVSFLNDLSNKLRLCHVEGDEQPIQRKVQKLKDTVKKLGASGEIKVIGELNLLFMYLKNACSDGVDIE